MSILTGDFAADPRLGGQPLCTHAATKVEVLTETAVRTDDTTLYLRHVEGGETIRALAREAGCHASTILRRIRRLEGRRDDPLVDAALSRVAGANALSAGRQDETRRILRRLAESGAELALAPGMDKAIVSRDGIRTAILDASLAEDMALHGWIGVVGTGRVMRYVITSAGRDALREMLRGRPVPMPQPTDLTDARPVCDGLAEDAAPFRAAQMGTCHVPDPKTGRRRRMRVNLSESPLQILARRCERDGSRFLAQSQIAAGERLREDFELAQLGPRVAQNWDRFMTAGIDVSRNATGHGGGSEAARNRVALALRDLGPGMGDLVLRVCCFLEGIEATEQRLGWSARSGKIVLRLALMRLERHYRETYGPGSPLIG